MENTSISTWQVKLVKKYIRILRKFKFYKKLQNRALEDFMIFVCDFSKWLIQTLSFRWHWIQNKCLNLLINRRNCFKMRTKRPKFVEFTNLSRADFKQTGQTQWWSCLQWYKRKDTKAPWNPFSPFVFKSRCSLLWNKRFLERARVRKYSFGVRSRPCLSVLCQVEPGTSLCSRSSFVTQSLLNPHSEILI